MSLCWSYSYSSLYQQCSCILLQDMVIFCSMDTSVCISGINVYYWIFFECIHKTRTILIHACHTQFVFTFGRYVNFKLLWLNMMKFHWFSCNSDILVMNKKRTFMHSRKSSVWTLWTICERYFSRLLDIWTSR